MNRCPALLIFQSDPRPGMQDAFAIVSLTAPGRLTLKGHIVTPVVRPVRPCAGKTELRSYRIMERMPAPGRSELRGQVVR